MLEKSREVVVVPLPCSKSVVAAAVLEESEKEMVRLLLPLLCSKRAGRW
jgi:hypothetical protein